MIYLELLGSLTAKEQDGVRLERKTSFTTRIQTRSRGLFEQKMLVIYGRLQASPGQGMQ